MATVVIDPAQLRTLLDAAERAQEQGQADESERLLTMAQEATPDHPAVLGALGLQSLRRGDASKAKDFLARAVVADPTNPLTLVNLATAMRSLEDPVGEMAALQNALTIDPYFSVAIFQKATLLERQGKSQLAANAYSAALASLRPGEQLPLSWQPLIEHAQRTVRTSLAALEVKLTARLVDLRARYGREAQDRVDDCLAAFLGKKRIYVQQPMSTHFPRLPAIEFFERSEFPWLGAVEAATEDIRNELLQLLRDRFGDFSPYLTHAPDAPLNQWRELNQSKRWSALFLYQDGVACAENLQSCPRTAAALDLVPKVRIQRRAPTAFFSRLESKTRIPPHFGVTNSRLTVHIPLIIPAKCGFRVGSQVREWQPGTALIFDDTIEHEAWNDSDEPRVIMIFDIWNPLLSEAERALMAAATETIAEYYAEGASTGRFV